MQLLQGAPARYCWPLPDIAQTIWEQAGMSCQGVTQLATALHRCQNATLMRQPSEAVLTASPLSGARAAATAAAVPTDYLEWEVTCHLTVNNQTNRALPLMASVWALNLASRHGSCSPAAQHMLRCGSRAVGSTHGFPAPAGQPLIAPLRKPIYNGSTASLEPQLSRG